MTIAKIDVLQVGNSNNERGTIRRKHRQQRFPTAMAKKREPGYDGF